MAWKSWSRTWATTRWTTTASRKPLRWSLKIRVENECSCFCEPIKGQSKTTETYSCRPIHKNFTHRRKQVDWCWARRLFSNRLPNVNTTEYSSSSWSSTSRRRWSDWILEINRLSSERSWAISTLVWWKSRRVHKQKAEETSKDFNVVLIHQDQKFFISELFKVIQDAISLILHDIDSDQFLRVQLSHRMCNQLTLHHEFRIDTRRTNFEHKTDGILHVCRPNEQGTQRSGCNQPECTASCLVQTKSMEETSKHGVLGWHQTGSKRKDSSSIKHNRTQSSFTTHFQLFVSRRLSWWNLKKSYPRKYMRHLDLLQRFPLTTIGWKNWIQKLLEARKTPNESNQRPKIQLLEQGDLFCQSNNLVRVFRKSKMFLTWLLEHRWKIKVTCFLPVVCQCLLNVQIKTKTQTKNVDADPVRTGRPVYEQPPGFVHTVRGLRHRLQGVGITTCSCQRSRKFPRSRAREADWKSSSSRNTSSRFAAK